MMQERPTMSRSSSRSSARPHSRSSSPRQKGDNGEKEPLPNVISKLDLGAHNAFEVRSLVWDQLELKLNVVEWNEAKSILGEDLIEANKGLKEENLALLSIWKEYSHTTSSIEEQCQHDFQATKSPLPEPPNVRDSLFKQIIFFIDELSRSSIRESITNPREKVVYEYVTRGMPSRPSTSTGARDKPNDTRPDSARSPPLSPEITSNSKQDKDTVTEEEKIERGQRLLERKSNIDIDGIQKYKESLKVLLRHEHGQLIKDAEFLHHCLDQQVDYNTQLQKYSKEKADTSTPSLQEMKEFKSKLEQKYIEMGPRKEEKERQTSTRSRGPSSLSSSSTPSIPSSSSSSSSSSSLSPSPSKPLRQSLPSPVPSRTRTPAPLTNETKSSSINNTNTNNNNNNNNNNNINNLSGNITHVPHPPKEQRSSESPQRPRAKLSTVSLSPSLSPSASLSTISPSSPSSSKNIPAIGSSISSSVSSSTSSISLSSSSASPKRTRLKQPT